MRNSGRAPIDGRCSDVAVESPEVGEQAWVLGDRTHSTRNEGATLAPSCTEGDHALLGHVSVLLSATGALPHESRVGQFHQPGRIRGQRR